MRSVDVCVGAIGRMLLQVAGQVGHERSLGQGSGHTYDILEPPSKVMLGSILLPYILI